MCQGLRDQLQRRLLSVAEERDLFGSEVRSLQQTVADQGNTIIGLQQENSWATNGAMSVEAPGVTGSTRVHQPPGAVNEWERDLAETLAQADRVVGGGREPEEPRRTRGRSPQTERPQGQCWPVGTGTC